jgi:2-dehydro-3-deoxygluconokinase
LRGRRLQCFWRRLIFMEKILCFGELLLRFSPDGEGEWLHAQHLPVFVGGAELNVARALALWGQPVGYVTALPENELSSQLKEYIRNAGVETGKIITREGRIGLYYLMRGSDITTGSVVYDRSHSSFANLHPDEIDWAQLFDGVTWLHLSAISPALNRQAAEVCLLAVQEAAARSLTVSIDLNYRSRLWQYGEDPVSVMPEIVQHCGVVMGNMWAVEKLLGVPAIIGESKGKTKEELIGAAGASMKAIHLAYQNIHTIAYTFRLPDTYFGVLQHGREMCVSQAHAIKQVVDGVGSGDCFMAGLIYGLRQRHPSQRVVDFAASAAAGKLSERGDSTQQTITQIEERFL